jgi:hypothetical protein
MENSNKSAFGYGFANEQSHQEVTGLTKREYFALHLMQGLLSGADRHSQEGDCQNWNYEHLSKISIQASDALLTELDKPKGGGE